MKTLNKKILTGCLALMMCIVMAVPAFAATSESVSPRATLNGWHYYRPYTVFDSRMAVSGSIGDGAEVKLKSKVNTTSQQFIARYAADGSLRIFSRLLSVYKSDPELYPKCISFWQLALHDAELLQITVETPKWTSTPSIQSLSEFTCLAEMST